MSACAGADIDIRGAATMGAGLLLTVSCMASAAATDHREQHAAANAQTEKAAPWNPAAVELRLNEFGRILKRLGLHTPMRGMRQALAREQDWRDAKAQRRWDTIIGYWDQVLLGKGDAAWGKILNLAHPDLQPYAARILAGDGDAAWAEYMRNRDLYHSEIFAPANWPFLLIGWEWNTRDIYRADGSFDTSIAEDIRNGKIRHQSLAPVQTDPAADYDWMVTFPGSHVALIGHQVGHAFMYPMLAYITDRSDTWVDLWRELVLSHIAQLPHGAFEAQKDWDLWAWVHSSYISQRLRNLVYSYIAMKNSPHLSAEMQAIVLRMIWYHARVLDSLGSRAYGGNTFSSAGLHIYTTAALFPELRHSEAWTEKMWPLFLSRLRSQILADGMHVHRSGGYHLSFLRRPLGWLHLARTLGRKDQIPEALVKAGREASEALARISTPVRGTPGINDDVLTTELHSVFAMMAATFERQDWLYLATDGRAGTPPEYRSVVLPVAGLIAMRSDWTRTARYLFFNVSPEAGHHHPDTLSVQFWAGGRHLLIDPGCGFYGSQDHGLSRQRWWHNCPTFGPENTAKEQPEILHFETTADLDYAVGRLHLGGAVLTRHVFFVDKLFGVLWDEFEALPADREIWENFHFGCAPANVEISAAGDRVMTTLAEGTNLLFRVGRDGWAPETAPGSKWLVYGEPPVPTTLVHYKASAGTAAQGFAAMFVPLGQQEAAAQSIFAGIQKRGDSTVRLHVSVRGKDYRLETKAF